MSKNTGMNKTAGIDLDIEIGDVILTGRYKNKRTIVKELGTDELGQPTVNGMKLLALRLEKKMPKSKQSKKTQMQKQSYIDGYMDGYLSKAANGEGGPIPGYREASGPQKCLNCAYYQRGQCTEFKQAVEAQWTCNEWESNQEHQAEDE
jgi:hypothetical protein